MDLEDEFYRRIVLIHGLDDSNAVGRDSVENSVDIRREEFQAMADVFLGENHDREKLEQIENLQLALHEQQATLCQRYENGQLGPEDYVDSFNTLLDKTFAECEKILGEMDFLSLFGAPRSELGGFIDKQAFLRAHQAEKNLDTSGVGRQSFREPDKVRRLSVIDRVLVGESLVGDGNEIAHVDLIIGPRGSAAEAAFCNALTNNKDGFTTLLAIVSPNLPTKPNTILFNKVTIKSAKQIVQMFGPAQRGVAMAVVDCVESGIIPANEADDVFICIGVFIHWLAEDDDKIQNYNYAATKEAIERAVKGLPRIEEVIMKKKTLYPFVAHV